jgi:hypothetical protein
MRPATVGRIRILDQKISDDHPYNEPVRLSRRRQPGAGVTLAHSWLSTLAAYPLITQP